MTGYQAHLHALDAALLAIAALVVAAITAWGLLSWEPRARSEAERRLLAGDASVPAYDPPPHPDGDPNPLYRLAEEEVSSDG